MTDGRKLADDEPDGQGSWLIAAAVLRQRLDDRLEPRVVRHVCRAARDSTRERDHLSVDDFEKILTNTDACLTRQYQALLDTEQVHVDFQPSAIKRLAEIAYAVNEKTENIGARRLYTVMERLLEQVSFEAGSRGPQTVTIDAEYVDGRLGDLAQSEDLSRYVL